MMSTLKVQEAIGQRLPIDEIKKPVVAIWRNMVLPISETFIAEQIKHTHRYDVACFGRRAANQDIFALEKLHIVNDGSRLAGKVESFRYTVTRQSPLLWRRLREVEPSLIHAHFGVDGVYALPYKRELGIPLITTFHGYDATRSFRRHVTSGRIGGIQYALRQRELREHGDIFLAVSGFIRDRLIARGFPQDRVVVHHIGVDLDRFAYREVPHAERRARILTVGRLTEKKGTAYLIRAVARLARRHPDIELEIVGDGELRRSLEQLADTLNITQHVCFMGALPMHEVPRKLAAADVFVLPSVTAKDGDSEGLPISILEAAATGVPIVATTHSGISEAIIDGESGLLVSERDVEQLTDALDRMLTDRELVDRMVREGRRLMETRFCLATQTERLQRIYDRAIEKA